MRRESHVRFGGRAAETRSVKAGQGLRSDPYTYIRTGEGWLYLAVVLDVGSRRLLGCAMSDRIDTRLVADALDMAANSRGRRAAGVVFHSDRLSPHITSPRTSASPSPAGGSPSRWAVSGHRRTTP